MKRRILSVFIIILFAILVSTCGNLMNNILDEITEGKSDVSAASPEDPEYQITYDANGADSGTVPADETLYAEGDEAAVLGNSGSLVKEGYFFTGWSLVADGSGDNYKENDVFSMGAADITFYARWVSPSKIIASDRAADDEFGYSVAISGDYAIVGSHLDDDDGVASGAAYIYYRTGINTWGMEEKITASDAAAGDEFGYSVSLSGDYAVIGSYLDDDNFTNSGSAYIYRRTGTNTWGEEAKLVLDFPAASVGDFFGCAVAVSGDYAVIGAYSDDELGDPNAGAAYIYHRTGLNSWDAGVKILAYDGVLEDEFGRYVAISGDYAVVCAWKADDGPSLNEGAVYVYHRTGTNAWDSGFKITASDGFQADYFGNSVSISGDYIVVGAFYNNVNGDDSGASYIYHRTDTNTWDGEAKLTASDGAAYDVYGSSVGISGDYAFVGAPRDDDIVSNSGSVYIYKRTGVNAWSYFNKLTAPDAATGDNYGFSVSAFGEYCIVGAYGDGEIGTDIGSAWVIQYR